MKSATLAMAAVFCAASMALAANVGSDNAGNYGVSNPWNTGSTGGTGFGAWNLSVEGAGGQFLGSSAAQNFGNIDTSAQAFGMWGNPAGANMAHASRAFDGGALSVGQMFGIKMAIAYRNGDKGIDLRNASDVTIWNFNVGGDIYSANGTDLGWAYDQQSIFNLVAVQSAPDSISITISRGAQTYTTTASGVLNGFHAYVGNTDAGNDLNNLFFNNMSVPAVPEPVTLGLFGLGLAGMMMARRRGKK